MFHFKKDVDGITIRMSGDSLNGFEEIEKILELNTQWPIVPIALEIMHNLCKAHENSKERLRDIFLLNSDETEGAFISDLEQMKVMAKKMELSGLDEEEAEDEE